MKKIIKGEEDTPRLRFQTHESRPKTLDDRNKTFNRIQTPGDRDPGYRI